MKEDLNKMKKNFESFTAVIVMVKNAVAHGSAIFDDARAAATHFSDHEMKNFGIDLGDIVRIVLVDNNKLADPVTDAAAVVRGLIDGAFKTHIPDLADCVADAEEIVSDIAIIVKDFTDGSPMAIIHGLTTIGELL